jgi:methyl-accepting chemotaxis protein
MTVLITGISQSTQRQASGLATVNTTVTDIERMTQQNAAMVEQASAATHSLARQAADLNAQLARFVLHPQPLAGKPTAPQLLPRAA